MINPSFYVNLSKHVSKTVRVVLLFWGDSMSLEILKDFAYKQTCIFGINVDINPISGLTKFSAYCTTVVGDHEYNNDSLNMYYDGKVPTPEGQKDGLFKQAADRQDVIERAYQWIAQHINNKFKQSNLSCIVMFCANQNNRLETARRIWSEIVIRDAKKSLSNFSIIEKLVEDSPARSFQKNPDEEIRELVIWERIERRKSK